MRIWLLNPYGPIPGEGWREYRFTLIGRALARRGHEVTWWTASFAHHFKKQRASDWLDLQDAPGFRIRLVPTPRYVSNVGVRRILFEIAFALRTYARARHEPGPDHIVAIEPPQVVSSLGTILAARYGAGLQIDLFDLWPELFEAVVPPTVRPAARLAFWPLRRLRQRALRRADLVTAVSDTYADLARSEVGNADAPRIETVHIGVDATNASHAMSAGNGVRKETLQSGLVAIYAGSLGAHYDMESLLEAGRLLHAAGAPVRILVAGDGPYRQQVAAAASSGGTVIDYIGIVTPEELWSVYATAHVGLCTYGPASTVSFPTKAFDYFAAGLPIVSSLGGEFARTLLTHRAGISYDAGVGGSLAAALTTLAGSPATLVDLQAGARTLGGAFEAERLYGRMAELIEA